ncbi:hypothetical protein [Streptomyces lunaelactis]|uniref:hypothetical protein n=1 Tax=Streptomyces lunaelactis TaxID=1535768 RepID=UPI001585728B|nr:hypothetical protein [Streptomyces lunaelactis]NUL14492.1 hypothetical protein [Streptomyces lunaelactis]
MTDSLDDRERALIAAINEISDDVERYQAVRGLEDRLALAFKQMKADAAKSLHDDRPWSQVGKLLGVTGSRAEQISRASR